MDYLVAPKKRATATGALSQSQALRRLLNMLVLATRYALGDDLSARGGEYPQPLIQG